MLNIQRQRLKNLMANAILDLWKKETGSMSSVLIEGTICITSGTGKTMVVQVSDRFTGVLRAVDEGEEQFNSSMVCESAGQGNKLELSTNQDSGFPCISNLDLSRTKTENTPSSEMSPESLVSPSMHRTQSLSSAGESLKSPSLVYQDMRDSPFYRRSQSMDLSVRKRPKDVTSDDESSDGEADNNCVSKTVSTPKSVKMSPVAMYTTPDLSSSAAPSFRMSDSKPGQDPILEMPRWDLSHRLLNFRTVPSAFITSTPRPAEGVGGDGDGQGKRCHPVTEGERSMSSVWTECDRAGRTEVTGTRAAEEPRPVVDREKPSPAEVDMDDRESSREEESASESEEEEEDIDIVETNSNCGGSYKQELCSEDETSRDVGRQEPSGSSQSSDSTEKAGSKEKDDDLDLSAPQEYTAQVRDVIRQRLLAQKETSATTATETAVPSQDKETVAAAPAAKKDFGTTSASNGPLSSVTVDTSLYPFVPPPLTSVGFRPGEKSEHERMMFLPPPSGPASWPVAGGREQMPTSQHSLSQAEKTLPHLRYTSPLPNNMPNGPPFLMSAPGLFPGNLGPGFPPRPMLPMPVGTSLHDILGLHKQPLPSPQGINFTGASQDNDDTHSMSTQASGRSTPDITDINGNSEKDSASASGEQKVYRCEYCSKTFLFKSKYYEHLPVHTNARPFQCHLCSRTYKYKYDLRVHLRTHMGIPTKSTVCPFCSEKFHTNKLLRLHIKESHKDRQRVSEEECTQQTENLPPAL